MAWGRKKRGRKEPQFGLGASLAELRLSPQDRVPAAAEDKPKKSAPRRKSDDDDDEPPRERKPRAARSGSNGDRRRARASASDGCSIGARCFRCGRRSPLSAW
jgi:penicillin-binding protein 1A